MNIVNYVSLISLLLVINASCIYTKSFDHTLHTITITHKNEWHEWNPSTIKKMKDSVKKVIRRLPTTDSLTVSKKVDGNSITFTIGKKNHKGVMQDTFHSLYVSLQNASTIFVEKIHKVLTAVAQAPHEVYVYFHGPAIATAAQQAVETVLEKEQAVAASAHDIMENALNATINKVDDVIITVTNNV